MQIIHGLKAFYEVIFDRSIAYYVRKPILAPILALLVINKGFFTLKQTNCSEKIDFKAEYLFTKILVLLANLVYKISLLILSKNY